MGWARGWCLPQPFFEAVESLPATGPLVLLSARGCFAHTHAVRHSLGSDRPRCAPLYGCDQRREGVGAEEISGTLS
jgi:hypothetical protein